MSTLQYTNEASLKPCPFCNQIMLVTGTVQFEKAEDEGFRVSCNCGWAGRQVRKWYSNKNKLIETWNLYIHDGEFTQVES